MKTYVTNAARLLISIGILGGLFYWIGIDKLVDNFKNVDFVYLGYAFAIFFVILKMMALRWHILLLSQNKSPGYFQLLMYYYIGYFFNNFLPTSIGGDVSRAYFSGKDVNDLPLGIGTVFFERMLGVMATLTLATFAIIFLNESLLDKNFKWMIVALTAFFTLMFFGLLSPKIHYFVTGILEKITFFEIGEKVIKMLQAVFYYKSAKVAVFGGYILSVCFQLLFVLMNFVLAKSLGLNEITFTQLLFVIPVSFVMGLLPSLNGLGVREYGYLLLLTNIFAVTNSDEAVALSLLNTSVPVMISLIGGVFLVFLRRNRKVDLAFSEANSDV